MSDMLEAMITQVEYTSISDETVIHIFGRDAGRRAVHIQVNGFRPYFYVPERDLEGRALPDQVTGVDDDLYQTIHGARVRRLYTRRPVDVRDIRGNFSEHFEADIPFTTRFLIDTGLRSGVRAPGESVNYRDLEPAEIDVPSRVCMMDIECDDRRGFPDPENDAVICITCRDSYDGRYTTFLWSRDGNMPSSIERQIRSGGLQNGCFTDEYHTIRIYTDETSMLRGWCEYIRDQDPDVLSGWNIIEFDIPYLRKRMERLGIPADSLSRIPGTSERSPIRGRAIFDLLPAYKKMQQAQKESYRLDAVAGDELGEGKVRYTGTVGDLWENEPDRLVEYNFKDVELCHRIDSKHMIIQFYRELAGYIGCPLDHTLSSSRLIDVLVLRRSHNRFVLPSRGHAVAEEFEGAVVFEPSKGLKENVVVLDLTSLYPMAMMTINASPETKDPAGELKAPNGVRFRKHPDGLTRTIIANLMEERKVKKSLRDRYPFQSPEYIRYNLQQNVIKVIMNSYYGVSGYPRFRLYDREIGAAVTSVGRAIIHHTRDVITDMGYTVLYGDTDSCMVQIPASDLDRQIEIAREIEARVNESYDRFAREVLNADRHWFSIKFEKVYRRFFQAGRKKRYAGHLVWKEGQRVDSVDVVGFEIRRSDYPHITKEVQRTVIEKIIRGEGFDEVKSYLRDVIISFRKGEYSLDDVGIPGGIGKNLEDYATDDAHIRGARYANKYLGTDFKKGSKPKRLYIRRVTGRYPRTDVICFEYADQVPPEFEVDWELMLNRTIRQPVSRIIEALGWNWRDVDPSRTTLADFGLG
ncbi:MAG: DNA-directed DNA polymerase [Methanoculleaceae archaeon]